MWCFVCGRGSFNGEKNAERRKKEEGVFPTVNHDHHQRMVAVAPGMDFADYLLCCCDDEHQQENLICSNEYKVNAHDRKAAVEAALNLVSLQNHYYGDLEDDRKTTLNKYNGESMCGGSSKKELQLETKLEALSRFCPVLAEFFPLAVVHSMYCTSDTQTSLSVCPTTAAPRYPLLLRLAPYSQYRSHCDGVATLGGTHQNFLVVEYPLGKLSRDEDWEEYFLREKNWKEEKERRKKKKEIK